MPLRTKHHPNSREVHDRAHIFAHFYNNSRAYFSIPFLNAYSLAIYGSGLSAGAAAGNQRYAGRRIAR